MSSHTETICSVSTAPGTGAIAVLRVSGPQAFAIVEQFFRKRTVFMDTPSHVAKLGEVFDGESLIDQVVFVKFAAPHSYDGEDMVELSCHGSRFIQQKILELLLQRGCRMAEPGEFTLRAFLNGKMDLPQAEAVGDLIDSQSESAHRLAVNQLKGGFSRKIADLRDRFIQLAALLELELDFSEEEVEFADRKQFLDLLAELRAETDTLVRSFRTGNALKNGVPVAIVGKPNVGKSTLLNALLNDDRAIVSDIPGTTRDTSSASSIPPASATPTTPSKIPASSAATGQWRTPTSSFIWPMPPPTHSTVFRKNYGKSVTESILPTKKSY